MNRIKFLFLILFLIVILALATEAKAAPMARIVRVADWHTVVVEHDGRQTAVTLTNIDVPPLRQAEATQYLGTLVGAWVLVENGNLYRSPDAMLVNDELRKRFTPTVADLQHHAMTYLGTSAPAAARRAPAPAPAKPASTPLPRIPPHRVKSRPR